MTTSETSETRMIDRRCRCGKPATELHRDCAWHDATSAQYAADLLAHIKEHAHEADKAPRVCACCGSDTWFAQNFERIRDQGERIRKEYVRQGAAHAVERAEWQLKQFDHMEEHRGLHSKIQRQRGVIRRLEARLRKAGVLPHVPAEPK